MSKITFKFINSQSEETPQVECIYNEAFPERERELSFAGLLEIAQDHENIKTKVALEEGKIIGFMYYLEMSAYIYLVYFAVNQHLRDGGYGSRMLKAFLEEHQGKTTMGFIESPLVGTSNYEQRVKRVAFYARIGMPMSAYSMGTDDENTYTVVASKLDDNLLLYCRDFLQLADQLSGVPLPEGTKFFREQDGRKIEIKYC